MINVSKMTMSLRRHDTSIMNNMNIWHNIELMHLLISSMRDSERALHMCQRQTFKTHVVN